MREFPFSENAVTAFEVGCGMNTIYEKKTILLLN